MLAEIKLGQIAMKVLVVTVLIYTLHAAFEDWEVTFNGIGMRVAATPFLSLMIDPDGWGSSLRQSYRCGLHRS